MGNVREVSNSHAPDFLSVREAAAVLRIGKTCAYELAQQFIHTGGATGLKVVRVGRQLRVPRTALEDMLGGPLTWPPSKETAPEANVNEVQVGAAMRSTPKRAPSDQPAQLFAL